MERSDRIQVLYEISLSIQPAATLEETARSALSTYLGKLNCSAGAVLERDREAGDASYRSVAAIPAQVERNAAYEDAREALAAAGDDASFPFTGRVDDDVYYAMSLPDFGALVLVRPAGAFDDATLTALDPLNEKLANACRQKQTEQDLREERNRFQAVFETIPEPLARLRYREADPTVVDVNSAFEEMFGYDAASARGRNLHDLIVPDDATDAGQPLDAAARAGESMTREVRREAVDGVRHFLLRSAAVETRANEREQFGLYVDITERKERERKLERLYDVTQEMLRGDDPEAICAKAVDAVDEILDLSAAGVHKYDRERESFVPVAVTDRVTELLDGHPGVYDDPDTVVWDAYRRDEPVVIDDVRSFDGRIPGEGTAARSAVVMPLGDYGVFIVSAAEPNAFGDSAVYFAQLLSTTLAAGLERSQRERGLEAIQVLTRENLNVDDRATIAAKTVERIPDALDLPLSAIYAYDESTDALELVRATDAADRLLGGAPETLDADSIAWQAFHGADLTVVDDVREHPSAYDADSVMASEVLVPLGDYGVLLTGSTVRENFTASDRRLLETLRANLETTFELVERRRDLELLDQILARVLRHNIRNDLTLVRAYATEILDRADDEEVVSIAEDVVATSASLERTAEYARDVREAVSRRGEKTETSLREVVADVAQSTGAAFPDATVETTVDADPAVSAHPEFRMAVEHLVRNGIEHHDTSVVGCDGPPRVSLRVFEDGDAACIAVADDGPGIPEMELSVLEEHGETALRHGSGIGLWIVDRVVEYSNAHVSFDTGDDGTVATIRFRRVAAGQD
jgi:PAS domain S-box-containing protein